MKYTYTAIPDCDVPRASSPLFQHLLDTYASETNKVVAVWRQFAPGDLAFRPHPRSSTVEEIMKHQILSGRRFFAHFLGALEPAPDSLLSQGWTPEDYANRLVEMVLDRLAFLAARDEAWWLTVVPFFDVERQRIWVFWRRLLHTAHHRTQLALYLRLLGKPVPAIYGPTADATWIGADPTDNVEAAGRP